MRMIILGVSACLSACVATVPVAEMDRERDKGFAIPPNDSLDQQKAPGNGAPPSSVTRVARAYVINLESAVDDIRLDQVPALPGFESQLIYTTEYLAQGHTWQRLRLGFFATLAEADEARKQLSAHYPQAWIAKTSESERLHARQHGVVAGTLTDPQAWTARTNESERLFAQRRGLVAESTTSSHPEPRPESPATTTPERDLAPVHATGMPTRVTGLKGLEGVPLSAKREPEPRGASDSADELWLGDFGTVSIAPKTYGPQREDVETEVTYGREDDESVFVRSSHKGGDLFTVGTAFTQRHQVDDLEARAKEDEGFWNMNVSSAPGGAGPGFEAEFAQSSFDPETSEGFGSSENRMIKLATHGSWQGYQLGVGYQFVGTDFEKAGKAAEKQKKGANHPKTELKKGREGTEAWISRQFGNLGVKTVAAVYQDEGEDDGSAAYFTTQELGASLNYTILSWPQLGVTVDYANGVRSSSDEPAGAKSREVDVESIASSLYYSDSSWSGVLYVEDATGAGTTNTMDLRTYYVGGSYFPVSTLSFSPGLTYVKEQYTDLAATTDSYTASLTASYKPSAKSKFNLNGYSEYSTQENADWALDTEYYYSSLGVNWVSDRPKPLIKQWSFEVFHDQYIDNVYTDSNTGGLGFWFTLKSSPSPVNRFVDEMR